MPVDVVDFQSRSTGGRPAASQPALDMLATFASVAAERFDMTWTDAVGGKVAFRSNRSLDEIRATLPRILDDAAKRNHNVIVRPRRSGPVLIQLDDLDGVAEAKLRPVSFLTLQSRVDGQRGTALWTALFQPSPSEPDVPVCRHPALQ
jgi:hypothetical protein